MPHDPEWDTKSPPYCPFSGDGKCPSDCPDNSQRVCVNGLEGEDD